MMGWSISFKATNQYHHSIPISGTTPAKVETSLHLASLVQHYLYSLLDVLLALEGLGLQIFAVFVERLYCLSLRLDLAL